MARQNKPIDKNKLRGYVEKTQNITDSHQIMPLVDAILGNKQPQSNIDEIKPKRFVPLRHPKTGRFISKSALADFVAKNNMGKPKGLFDPPSASAFHNVSSLGHIVDPFVLLASLRRQQTYLEKIVQISETEVNTAKAKGGDEVRETKAVQREQAKTTQQVRAVGDTLNLVHYGVQEIEPILKETEKYNRETNILLEKILDALENESRTLRLIPFQLDTLNQNSQTCGKCSREGEGGEEGSLGKALGAAALGFGAYKAIRRLRNFRSLARGRAGMNPTEPLGPDEPYGEVIPPERGVESTRGVAKPPLTIEGEVVPDLMPEPAKTGMPDLSSPKQLDFARQAPGTDLAELGKQKELVPHSFEGEVIPPEKPLTTTQNLAKQPPTIDVFPEKNGMQIPETPKIEAEDFSKVLGNSADRIAGFLVKQGVSRALNFIPGANILSRIIAPNTDIMSGAMEKRLIEMGNAQHAGPQGPTTVPLPHEKAIPTQTQNNTKTQQYHIVSKEEQDIRALARNQGVPYVGEFAPKGTRTAAGMVTNTPYGLSHPSGQILEGTGRVGESYQNLPTVNIQGTPGQNHSPQEAIDFFVKKGWSREQAAGITANLQRESHLNPGVVNATGHAGIAQWDGHRQAIFQQKYGHPVTQGSFTEQLDFVDWELNNTEANAGARLKQAKTASASGEIVGQSYERFGNHPAENAARMNLAGSFDKQYADLQSKQNNSSDKIKVADEEKKTAESQQKLAQNQGNVVVNAPTNIASNQQPQIAGPMPRVRSDDPVILHATHQDMMST